MKKAKTPPRPTLESKDGTSSSPVSIPGWVSLTLPERHNVGAVSHHFARGSVVRWIYAQLWIEALDPTLILTVSPCRFGMFASDPDPIIQVPFTLIGVQPNDFEPLPHAPLRVHHAAGNVPALFDIDVSTDQLVDVRLTRSAASAVGRVHAAVSFFGDPKREP